MAIIDYNTRERDNSYILERPSRTQSAWLPQGDALRILAAIAVVALHVSAYGVLHYGAITTYSWWVCNIVDSACRWVVPLFVMLSGAVLLHPAKEEPFDHFFRKRFTRIGIPFVFWTVFYLLWQSLYNRQDCRPKDMLENLLAGVPYYHLHFMFVITGLYLLTPVLRTLVKHTDRSSQIYFIIAIFLLSVGDTLARAHHGDQLNAFNRFVPYIGYYYLGYLLRDCVLSRNQITVAWTTLIGAFLITVAGAAIGVARKGIALGLLVYEPLSPTTIAVSICVFLIASSVAAYRGAGGQGANGQLRKLAEATLGVYLIHPTLIDLLRHRGVTAVWPNVWLGTFGSCAVVVVGSFVMARCLQRIPYLRRLI